MFREKDQIACQVRTYFGCSSFLCKGTFIIFYYYSTLNLDIPNHLRAYLLLLLLLFYNLESTLQEPRRR
jgi:hypothetical protein